MNKQGEPINAYAALREIIESQRQTITALTEVVVELKRLNDNQTTKPTKTTKKSMNKTLPKVNDKQIITWCGFHGLLCTGCSRVEHITVGELKNKSYKSSQYSKQRLSPYENWVKNFKMCHEQGEIE